jgi:ParB-like chromosome segregation protein Spo0J
MKYAKLPLQKVKISEIQTDIYNPREPISLEYKEYIRKNINDPNIGFLEPLIININPDRKNILISGHVRLDILKEDSYDEVDVSVVNVNKEKEMELNLAFNKIRAEFSLEKLKLIPPDILALAGFSAFELAEMQKLDFSDIDNKLQENAEGLTDDLVLFTFKVKRENADKVKEVCNEYGYDLFAIISKL